MKRVYTGIDIGSDTIKIVTNEVIDGKFYCLASTSFPSKGVKKGWIVDEDLAVQALQGALLETEKILGIKTKEVIVTVPSYQREFTITEGSIEVKGDESIVDNSDMIHVLQDAVLGHVESSRELITISPISFHLDQGEGVKSPLGQVASTLSVKTVLATVPKENVDRILSVFKKCNVDVIDMVFSETGDYYELKNKTYDNSIGAVINIGYETTRIAVYNKGIMIKNEIIDLGARNIDNDIKYVYHVDKATAKYLKENFAVSNKRYADVNDTMDIMTKSGEKVTLNQLELSEVVEARITEILKLAKKQISILTNREISYIIITGGISELAGFQYVVDNVLGRMAITLTITSMGLRNNKFSSATGITKYFHEKLSFRGREYSMLDEKTSVDLVSPNKKKSDTDATSNTIIGKLFGYFLDNN